MAKGEMSQSPGDPIIVFDDPEDFGAEQVSICIRRRQPSFSFLGRNPVPKGFLSLAEFTEKRHLVNIGRDTIIGSPSHVDAVESFHSRSPPFAPQRIPRNPGL
jgi:hypothetical protein